MWLLSKDETIKEKLMLETAIHSQVLNGLNTLQFTCLNSVEKYDRIVYKDESLSWHEFIVQRVTTDNERNSVYAEHSSYELYASYIDNRRPTETVSRHLEILLEGTRWKVGNVEVGDTVYQSYYYIPIYTAIQNLCQKSKGELEFKIEVKGNKITKRLVNIKNRVGNNLGKRFTYSKDLINVNRTILDDEVYTALVGRGRGEEIEETGGFGRRIMFTDLNKPDSPKGTEFVFDDAALEEWGLKEGEITRHRFGLVEFDEIDDIEELYKATKEKLQVVKQPQVNYECDVLLLSEPSENVGIGDIVSIIDNDFLGKEIRIKGRVIQLEKNIVEPDKSVVVLGNFARDFVRENIELNNYVNNFRSRSGVWDRSNAFDSNNQLAGSYIKELLKAWNDNINQSGGFVYAEHGQGIMTYDKPIDQNPTKVTQLVGGALRIANSKLPNGEWDWRTVLTGDGIAGQEIIANSITVNQVSSDFGASLDISSNKAINLITSMIPAENAGFNMNAELGYIGFEFFDVEKVTWADRPKFAKDMPWRFAFTPVITKSLSKYSLRFFTRAKTLFPRAYVVPTSKYSYRFKVMEGNPDIKVFVREYNSDFAQIKRTELSFEIEDDYLSASIDVLAQMTVYTRLEIETLTNTPFILSEGMYNRGEPREYVRSITDVENKTEAMISIQNGQIQEIATSTDTLTKEVTTVSQKTDAINRRMILAVDSAGRLVQVELGVDPNTGSHFVVKADSINLEGLTTINGGFKVLPDGFVEMVNANVSGTITATRGKIGGFNISGQDLVGEEISIKPKEIKVGNAKMKGSYIETLPSLNIDINRLGFTGNPENSFVMQVMGSSFLIHFANSGVRSINVDNISVSHSGYGIGNETYRFGNIYLQNQPNVSSDLRYKRNISLIDDLLLDEFENVEEKSFVTKHDDNFSFGYIAQDVETALCKYVAKVWGYKDADQWLKKFKMLSKSESYRSLLYAEVQVVILAVEKRRVKRLEDRVANLESKVGLLINKIEKDVS